MSTAAVIVDRALKTLGATSILNPAAPEVSNDVFIYLKDMLNQWSSQNTNIGVAIPDVLGDELAEPAFATAAMVFSLAAWSAPFLRMKLSKQLSRMVDKTYKALLTRVNPRPVPQYPNTLPLGQGNHAGPYSRTFYPEPETVDTESDPPITT